MAPAAGDEPATAAGGAPRFRPDSPVGPLPPRRPQAGARGLGAERAGSGEAGGELPSVPRPPHALPACNLFRSLPPGPDWARPGLPVLIGGAKCPSPPLRAARRDL